MSGSIIIPVGARVLVRRVEAEVVSKGGVVLPDAVAEKDRPHEGMVIAFGTRCTVPLHKGERVLFGAYAGLPLAGEDKDLVILNEDEIVAVRLPEAV